jgi:WD40 repeat protein
MGNDTSAMTLRHSQSSPSASLLSPCLTELSIATVHKDRAIKHAIFVGSNTIATSGDDPSVHLWDTGTLSELSTLPGIACKATLIASVANNRLVTAHESDGSAFLWDLSDRLNPVVIHKLQLPTENPDDPTRFVHRVHRIVALEGGWFATACLSVSDDRWLYVWNEAGLLFTRIERQDGDKLSDMLYMRVSDCPCLVTCHEPSSSNPRHEPSSSNPPLYIYRNIKDADARKRVSPQIACTELPGAVVILHKVDHSTFASGSADGSVILWEHVDGASEPQFKPRELRRCDSQSKTPTDDWRVRQMVNIFNSAYLLVVVGYGFFMFHVQSGQAILQLDYVHENLISHVVVVSDDDTDSFESISLSSSTASSKSAEKSVDGPSSSKDAAAASKSSTDMRMDIDRLQKIVLVSVSGNSFCVWRVVEAIYKKTIDLPPANQNPFVKKKSKQQPKFKNAQEPEAINRLDAIFIQVFSSFSRKLHFFSLHGC